MEIKYFKNYELLIEQGIVHKAKNELDKFINSFNSLEEKEIWTKEFLSSLSSSISKIRFEIYKEIVFPVLSNGYKVNDIWSIFWIAKLNENITLEEFRKETNYESPLSMLKRINNIDPENELFRNELSTCLYKGLKYSFHELPSGVLEGTNGATIEESIKIEDDLKLFSNLDNNHVYENEINKMKVYLEEYIQRLKSKNTASNIG